MVPSLDDQHTRVVTELRASILTFVYMDYRDPDRERLRNRISVLNARDKNLSKLRFDLLEKMESENEGNE